jgi:hypothetical protein
MRFGVVWGASAVSRRTKLCKGYWASALEYSGRLEVYVAKFTATEKIILKGGVLIGYYWYARKAMCTCTALHQEECKVRSPRETFESFNFPLSPPSPPRDKALP